MYVSGKCNTFLIFFLFFKTMANTSVRQYQRHIHNNVYLCNRVILKCWFHVAQFKLNSGAGEGWQKRSLCLHKEEETAICSPLCHRIMSFYKLLCENIR